MSSANIHKYINTDHVIDTYVLTLAEIVAVQAQILTEFILTIIYI